MRIRKHVYHIIQTSSFYFSPSITCDYKSFFGVLEDSLKVFVFYSFGSSDVERFENMHHTKQRMSPLYGHCNAIYKGSET
jgi:hypothetical protein